MFMTRDEIDTMWQQALRRSAFSRFEIFTRYHFAELLEAKVRADERKECAAICRKEAAETDKHLSIVIEALEDCAYFIEKRGHK